MKRIVSLFLSLVMAATLFGSAGLTASAAGNSIATATPIGFGTTYNGSITSTNLKDVYRFNLDVSGRVDISLTAFIREATYVVYDADGNKVWDEEGWWNFNTQIYKMNEGLELTKGTYYFAVLDSEYGSYNFTLSFTSANESFSEPQGGSNDSMVTASAVSLGKTYKGQLALNEDRDIYKFTLSTSGRIGVVVSSYVDDRTDYYIYNTNGETVWQDIYNSPDANTGVFKLNELVDLMSGTYYLAINKHSAYDSSGNYSFKLNFASAGESFAENINHTNNSISEADGIYINKSYKGQLALNDRKDLYRFNLTKAGTINLKIVANIENIEWYIYDINGNTVRSDTYNYWNENKKQIVVDEDIPLSKGTYYLAITTYAWYDYTGNYSVAVNCAHSWSVKTVTKATQTKSGKLANTCNNCKKTTTVTVPKIKSIKLSTSTYTYNGKKKTPSVKVKDSAGKSLTKDIDYTVKYYGTRKSTGKYKVKVTFKGKYSGSKTLYFKILPSKTSKISVKATKTTLKPTWKKVTGATGYRVQLKSSKGKVLKTVYTKKLNYTFKSLKKSNKYKITITAYKTIDGKKAYSKSSKSKTAYTK